MYFLTMARRSAVALFVLAAAGCADRSATAPVVTDADANPAALSANASFSVGTALLRTTPLAEDEYAWDWVAPNRNSYQTVKLRQAGLKVSFPPGSVTKRTLVVLRAHAGEYVTYEFYPHGTTFAVPIKVQQDLHGTTAYQNAVVMADLFAGYLGDGLGDLDPATGLATFAETFDVIYHDGTSEFTKTTPSVAKFYTNHFSGYALASGRLQR